MRASSAGIVIALAVCAFGCSRGAALEYELRGQIIEINPARQEITIRHDDIPAFMPAMTMPFKVRDRRLLQGRVPGEFIRARLVVEERDAHLRSLDRTGFAPLSPSEVRAAPMDVIEPGALVADAVLIDEQGSTRRLSDWRGMALAVTFMYTGCPLPNFCPQMDRHFKSVQDQILAHPDMKRHVRLLSVSFDPDRDTAQVLAKHAAQLGADPSIWRFATGAREDVDKFAGQFGVSILRSDPRETEIVHNLRTAIIDGDRRLVAVLKGSEWMPSDLVAQLRNARAR